MNVHLKKLAQVALSKKKKKVAGKTINNDFEKYETMNNYDKNIYAGAGRQEMKELCKKWL